MAQATCQPNKVEHGAGGQQESTGRSAGAALRDDADTQYTYGMHLDIAEVVWVTATPVEDAVYPSTMEYIDHQGQTQRLEYIVTDTTWGGK
ncbi:hypothetical protein D3C76_1190790 [compost metagenome]